MTEDRTKKFTRADWQSGTDPWRGHLNGVDMGTNTTVLFYATDEVGVGAKLHVHDYDEIFIVRNGRALYTIGGRKIVAEQGDILIGPRNMPHKFHNLGPGRLETVDIHLNPRWVQTDVDDPDLAG